MATKHEGSYSEVFGEGKKTYRCWEPDAGETEADAVVIDDYSFNGAAEAFAERRWKDHEPFDFMDVRVAFSGVERDYNVEVRAVPTFTAKPIRPSTERKTP